MYGVMVIYFSNVFWVLSGFCSLNIGLSHRNVTGVLPCTSMALCVGEIKTISELFISSAISSVEAVLHPYIKRQQSASVSIFFICLGVSY